MNRHVHSSTRILTIVTLLWIISFNAFADDFVKDGITYSYYPDSKTAAVIAYDSTSSIVNIPAKIMIEKVLFEVTTIEVFFNDNTNIKEITIADELTYNGTFRNCTNLTTAVIPWTSIPDQGFYNCPNLNISKVITSKIEYIGNEAFALPTPENYESIALSDYGLEYKSGAFKNRLYSDVTTYSAEWSSNFETSAIKKLHYKGHSFLSYDADLPSLSDIILSGYVTEFDMKGCNAPLKTINMSGATALKCFSLLDYYNSSNITKLEIPTTVTNLTITDLASLKTLNGCDGVTDATIRNCTILENISLPAIERLDNLSCPNLKEVYLGKSLKTVQANVLEDCKVLEDLIYGGTIEQWNEIDFVHDSTDIDCYTEAILYHVKRFWYGHGNAKLIYLTELTDLGNATKVKPFAFTGYNMLTKVSLPPSIKTIGACAFAGCKGLTEVSVHAERLEYYSFLKTSSLTTLRLGKELKYIGPAFSSLEYRGADAKDQILKVYYDGTINQWNLIERSDIIAFDSGYMRPVFATCDVPAIANGGFYVNGGLVDDTIVYYDPEIITGLRGYTRIKKIIIHCKTRYPIIAEAAFQGCVSLTSVVYTTEVPGEGGFDVRENAFEGCTSLSEIGILDRLKSVSSGCFDNTKWLNDLPDGLVYLSSISQGKLILTHKGQLPEGSKIIPDDDTETIINISNPSITEIAFPSTLRIIGDQALNNTKLKDCVTLPASIEYVGDQQNLYNFTADKLVISDAHTPIKKFGKLSGWGTLKSAYIGRDIEASKSSKVPSSIFMSSKITSITYGSMVTRVGAATQTGNYYIWPTIQSNLTDIYVQAKVPPVCEKYDDIPEGIEIEHPYIALNCIDLSTCRLHVPKGCLDAYKAAEGWKDFLIIEDDATSGIENVVSETSASESIHYDYMGHRIMPEAKGLHIIRNSDGSTSKVIVP